MFRLIGFGIRVWGCLYLAYWLLFFGIVGVLIITSYLREPKHNPAVKTPHMSSITNAKAPKRGKATSDWRGNLRRSPDPPEWENKI